MTFDLFGGTKRKEVERKFTTFSEQLARAFGQIKDDISSVSSKVDANQKELEQLRKWVDYLHRYNQHLTASHTQIAQKHEKIAENHQKLHSSHTELLNSHSRTAQMAENLENRHQELHKAVLAQKSELQEEVYGQLKQHKEISEKELKSLKTWLDYLSSHLDQQKRKEDALKEDLAKTQKGWSESYSSLRELLNGLRSENTSLKSNLDVIRKELENSKKELDDAKNMAKSHILEAKSEIYKHLESKRQVAQQQVVQPEPVQQVVQQLSPSSFQRHIMARVMPNRRGYVLKFILDLIGENKYSTKEIEEIVVNEKQLCGRTSFYAYLKELKLKGRINYAEIDERMVLVNTDTQQRLQ